MEYPPEYLANPKNHRTRSSILIEGPTGNLLVDCSPEMRLQMSRERIYDVEAVLITHTHADHVMGMDDLRSICMKTRQAVPVYTLPIYQEDIRRIYSYAFRDFPEGVFVPRFDLRDVPVDLEVGGLRIRTFLVEHGGTTVIGLRVGGFAYITDVSRIPDEAMRELDDLDVLMIDAVRIRPHPNHFNLEQAIAISKQIGARKTYLTHLSHDYDHDETNAQLPYSFELAWDGLKIQIEAEAAYL
ncbi:MBL fold metallo-hydrolase [Fimbriimonas ginsengisoli]|uniref:MBL fold metallo-hydrolase n=1 Tax=Fimbriimonas ginsengisoli TaxID=1005039 RepID=UPI001D0E70FE|nr:MBL fold metallo-hydrolase [Fimbriimonas ginsengisoli]